MPVRTVGLAERSSVDRLLDRHPIDAAQVAERIRGNGLTRWRSEGRLLGYGPRRKLEALCWVGANLVPVNAGPPAVAAFAEAISSEPRLWTSMVGPADAVLGLRERLEPIVGPAREVRRAQPLMVTHAPAPVPPDPEVRLVRPDEIDLIFPASVAMYTEEIGVSPLADEGDVGYRARVAELVRGKRSYARFADGDVVFKAELAVVTRHTAQVQGVWVAPQWRGRGLAVPAMATVVADALRRVAPSVSLYVNDYNVPARRVYDRCGFREVGTFATVLF